MRSRISALGAGAVVGHPPEQEVVLQAGGGAEPVRMVELDGGLQADRQQLGEGPPGSDEPLLGLRVEQP